MARAMAAMHNGMAALREEVAALREGLLEEGRGGPTGREGQGAVAASGHDGREEGVIHSGAFEPSEVPLMTGNGSGGNGGGLGGIVTAGSVAVGALLGAGIAVVVMGFIGSGR